MRMACSGTIYSIDYDYDLITGPDRCTDFAQEKLAI